MQRLMTHEAIGHAIAIRVLRGDRWLDLEVSPVELVDSIPLGGAPVATLRTGAGRRSFLRPRSGSRI